MKRLIYLIPLLVLIAVYVAARKPETPTKEAVNFFEGTWKEALLKAKTEKKLIFLDIYASWCGPCKQLKKYTFANQQVGDYMNANFINVSLDGEKGDGVALADEYKIQAYPTLMLIDSNGNLVMNEVGFYNSSQFLVLIQNATKNHK